MVSMSAFEVLGPIMIGPSSSHTAGALRCAAAARALCSAEPARVTFTLWNSFSHTHKGHGTDRALVGGMLGFDTDDERIRDSFAIARERGLDFSFRPAGDSPSMHPNTVDIDVVDACGSELSVRAESLGGARIRLCRINGVEVDILGEYETVFVSHRDVPGALAQVVGAVADYGVNIAFMKTYRAERGGTAYTVLEMDDEPPAEVLEQLQGIPAVLAARSIHIPGAKRAREDAAASCDFSTGAELLDLCAREGASIGELMRRRELEMFGPGADEAMARVLAVMEASSSEPVRNPRESLGGFIGGEAQSLDAYLKRNGASLLGPVLGNACTRALAVLEQNASMGVIAAAPTAGSAGVVPGCVLAACDVLRAGDANEVSANSAPATEALWCAAAVGMLLSQNASVAGAEGGCQAEVGSAAAMSAAALVELQGGSPAQALDAASLAIANLLGLVCDPIAGLVEAPCQFRNVIGVSDAFTAATLALSGMRSVVPFDEAVDAMARVGKSLPAELRETARGGLATCPSACAGCPSADN